jgi:hypothetical protein
VVEISLKSFFLAVICITLVSWSVAQSSGPAPAGHIVSPDAVAVQVDWDALPQNPEPVPATSSAPEQGSAPQEKGSKAEKIFFGLMPNNKSVQPGEHAGVMSNAEKFKLTRDYLSPFTLVFVAFAAGFDQAIDAKPGYGQGWEGYGKRYGADFANGLTHTLFVTGVYPSLLHQDPRYYRRATGSFAGRATYAATRVLVTRNDSGDSAFNYSEILGSATSAGIAHVYYPEVDRTASGFFVRAGLQIVVESGFNLLREFRPDITRRIFRRQ